ncbi:related to DUR1,2-Urea amidolyase [Zygosaccharomyces bailii ISA1307]|nr:related to DUR1,2-Urea amidolyase [Zygosaccharomyces bailii ISA1307]
MTEFKQIQRVLIANRGEIACRIIRACKSFGLTSITIYSKEDIQSLHTSASDEAELLTGTGAAAYINIQEIVSIAKKTKADVVIPGYGFLSENADFAEQLRKAGVLFAGPSSQTILDFGLKHRARELAIDSGVPVVPGSGLLDDPEQLVQVCSEIGYPVMLKSTAGGGGMGLKICNNDSEVLINFSEVKSRGASLFSHSGVFVEKYIPKGHHIEVQLFGNGNGDVVTYGERECSIQRRHQKIIEEAPSPYVSTIASKYDLRKRLTECAKRLASHVKYKSAGTVEFFVDDETGFFYFLEVNTRLQVEHGITELVYGVDLVYLMLIQAEYESRGEYLSTEIMNKGLSYDENSVEIPNGHAIEMRIYAENPVKNFVPSPGVLHYVNFPDDLSYNAEFKVRIDHWITTGCKISPYFDPLLAKVMVWSPCRTSINAATVLDDIEIQGPICNKEFLVAVLNSDAFKLGNTVTNFLSSFKFKPHLVEFEEPGTYTTIQDIPGRPKIRTGVPQSGPVDSLSLQIANIVVENDSHTEGLEVNMKGPLMRFHSSAIIAIAGGEFPVRLLSIGCRRIGKNLPMFTELFIPAGSLVEIGEAIGRSCKCYIAFKGGLPGVAPYLGSKSCTPGLSIGGHQGRILFPGDCLALEPTEEVFDYRTGYKMPSEMLPDYERNENIIRMVSGPHDTPDIVSVRGLDELYNSEYRVNFNSNRGAMRLDGPPLKFSRTHGGDGGGHPSNILEYPYPTGGLSAVGSNMVLFGVDGATLSGFTCISVPVEVDFWKFGQARVNSPVRFRLISFEDSIKLKRQRARYIELLKTRPRVTGSPFCDELKTYEALPTNIGSFLHRRREDEIDSLPYVAFRQAGESMIVIDFGTDKFSLFNNGRQYALQLKVEKLLESFYECIECCSGAMCITFDSLKTDRFILLSKLIDIEKMIPPVEKLNVPSRIFELPICFNHSSLTHCLERYIRSQRPHAPYLPSNTKYLMRANCIKSFEDFKKHIIGQPEVVVAVSFLCANPLLVNIDPRLRFMTSKYNPARTSTPSGAVGSGSVSQSIYTVDSPGGYMVWGLTLPDWYWDTFSRIHDMPWPLQNFDQIVFYEVDERTLTELNMQLITKRKKILPQLTVFDFVEYKSFVDSIKTNTASILDEKRGAFQSLMEAEEKDIKLWQDEVRIAKKSKVNVDDFINEPGAIKVAAAISGSVFKINFEKGSMVTAGDALIILEAMKMEIAVTLNAEEKLNHEILQIAVDESDMVNPGDILAIVKCVSE